MTLALTGDDSTEEWLCAMRRRGDAMRIAGLGAPHGEASGEEAPEPGRRPCGSRCIGIDGEEAPEPGSEASPTLRDLWEEPRRGVSILGGDTDRQPLGEPSLERDTAGATARSMPGVPGDAIPAVRTTTVRGVPMVAGVPGDAIPAAWCADGGCTKPPEVARVSLPDESLRTGENDRCLSGMNVRVGACITRGSMPGQINTSLALQQPGASDEAEAEVLGVCTASPLFPPSGSPPSLSGKRRRRWPRWSCRDCHAIPSWLNASASHGDLRQGFPDLDPARPEEAEGVVVLAVGRQKAASSGRMR